MRVSEPYGLAGRASPSSHTALLCHGTCHSRGPLSLPGACAGDVGSQQGQGPPTCGLLLPGPSVHLLKGTGSEALGSVQRTPGDQAKSHPISCVGLFWLLEQVQESGLAQPEYVFPSHHITPLSPFPRLAGVPAHLKLSGCQDSCTILPNTCFVALLNPFISLSLFSRL